MGLELHDIRHSYDGEPAVDGATLFVRDGEIVCLFGPSGCGKTTLLRLAAGFERLQSGVVRLDGQLVADAKTHVAPERRSIGFVFQDYVLFPHLTALENVAFGLSDLARPERRARAAKELTAAGLEGLGARWPHQLSGGQQQRVALARAMARQPRTMLLDEPFAGIDASLRRRLRSDVRRILKGAGAATLFVTHDAEEALAVCDRIAVMRAGKILEIGSPQALFVSPACVESALLFAGAQRFSGLGEGGVIKAAFGEFSVPSAPDGALTVVAMPHAASFAESAAGRLQVVESRFIGPLWRVEAHANGASLWADSPVPFPSGRTVEMRLATDLLRIFPA